MARVRATEVKGKTTPQTRIKTLTGKGKTNSAINLATGNKIARDASSGRFFIVESPSHPKRLTSKEIIQISGGPSIKKNDGGFTINKRKAERAEKVVLSYLNDIVE